MGAAVCRIRLPGGHCRVPGGTIVVNIKTEHLPVNMEKNSGHAEESGKDF